MHDHHPAFPRTGATADLPAETPAPEQDMGQTRALLLEMARCQSLDQIFRLVAETFAARLEAIYRDRVARHTPRREASA